MGQIIDFLSRKIVGQNQDRQNQDRQTVTRYTHAPDGVVHTYYSTQDYMNMTPDELAHVLVYGGLYGGLSYEEGLKVLEILDDKLDAADNDVDCIEGDIEYIDEEDDVDDEIDEDDKKSFMAILLGLTGK